ncbi:DUF5995 family protein [Dactylosporangium sp. AC04546]|uniref:DUF5995 family protein n=1 Tax=Dactylosporangium sp. AC04546 TaxID=2862460 RepID=UPI001EDFBC4B|nr:DUF5995 family protein [Dactylosporangium sp. AC04546]WVK80025.1 DUF5995 family protein [Dactylosporangium sp. AC04546]
MDGSVARIVRRMEDSLGRLDAGDARRFFHQTYLRTTLAVAEEIDRGGFLDGPWLERWDVVFAELYLDAFDARLDGAPVAGPWTVAFDAARERPELPPLRHVLLGMNAHINYDLPQSLVAVISPAEFDDPSLIRRRAADHRHVDTVLVDRVGAEDAQMRAVSGVRLRDRLLGPLNRAATKRVLREARAKVWHNTAVLDRARRDGTTEAVLRRLDRACTAKLVELTAPGQVMLRLARRGFGVTV